MLRCLGMNITDLVSRPELMVYMINMLIIFSVLKVERNQQGLAEVYSH